jgi:ferredoxin
LQAIKYYLLLGLLTAAAGDLVARLRLGVMGRPSLGLLLLAGLVVLAWLSARQLWPKPREAALGAAGFTVLGLALAWWASPGSVVAASLQSGLLDPIPLAQRSVNLFLLPAMDAALGQLAVTQRHYQGAWLIAALFVAALLMNLKVPRFYCRFVCPTGALMGILGRWALLRVGRTQAKCRGCHLCQSDCEGACQPAGHFRQSECVLCMNCLDSCRDGLVTYQSVRSAAGEITGPDLTRRGVVASLLSGFAAVPALRLGGLVGPGWQPTLIRPPGALDEPRFLERCLKCGQCMRVCPTNVIQPAGLDMGLEALWTPSLNMRMGTSGCQLNCVACGQICPTAAIRPITLDEKRGLGAHASAGPIRLGTAFVDPGRCLPWAFDRPCIVCQENCPVSPKAITTREHFGLVVGRLRVSGRQGDTLTLSGGEIKPGLGSGDYFLRAPAGGLWRIAASDRSGVTLAPGQGADGLAPDAALEIVVRLQRPVVDPARCIGCGVCEHECPVSGLRAIRVSAENATRDRRGSLLL